MQASETSSLEEFRRALISTYCENPCQVLPNALWKTLDMLSDSDRNWAVHVEDGHVARLEAWSKGRLLVCWDRARGLDSPLLRSLDDAQLALVHDDYHAMIQRAGLWVQESYFRLVHHGSRPDPIAPHTGLRIADVDPQRDGEEVATFISACYANIDLTEREIQDWMAHPVYASDLWVWVMDESTDCPVGLGIGELDTETSEGSLEWIQVLPTYRRRGIGSCIVSELLQRLSGRSDFTTVSGAADNETCPEKLYRQCGFEGNDLWHVLRPGRSPT